MVTGPILEKEYIKAGSSLLAQLDSAAIKPEAAFWYLRVEIGWKLFFSFDFYEKKGSRAIYLQIQRSLANLPPPSAYEAKLMLGDIVVVGAGEPFIKSLKTLLRTKKQAQGFAMSDTVLNRQQIAGLYIYRLEK